MIKFTNTRDICSEKFCALIVGESGEGKTYSVRSLDSKETLILSAESGLLCLKGCDIAVYDVTRDDDGNQLATNIERVKRIVEFFKFLQNPEAKHFKNIFIDSLTDIADIWLKALEEQNPSYKDPKNNFLKWGQYTTELTGFIKTIRDMPHFNVFFTCLTKKEKEGMGTYDEFHLPGDSLRNSVKGWFDEVFVLKTWILEDGTKERRFLTSSSDNRLAKDRSGKLEAYEVPDLTIITNKILGV